LIRADSAVAMEAGLAVDVGPNRGRARDHWSEIPQHAIPSVWTKPQ
jgi:hypothetical protein